MKFTLYDANITKIHKLAQHLVQKTSGMNLNRILNYV